MRRGKRHAYRAHANPRDAKPTVPPFEAERAPRALCVIEPQLAALKLRLTEVATCSTLVALVLIDVLRISGHAEQALALTEEMIALAVAHQENVYLPELLRVRGEQRQSAAPAAAMQDYREAVELARRMGARSWELRAGVSLAGVTG